MALIACPECGGQVSDRAPSCPHCGVPVASAQTAASDGTGASSSAQRQPSANTAPESGPALTSDTTTADQAKLIEPYKFRLAGRRIPIAGILFWGGMVVGIMMKYMIPLDPGTEPELWRRLPWAMIWIGVLWFAVTEFTALIRNKMRHRQQG